MGDQAWLSKFALAYAAALLWVVTQTICNHANVLIQNDNRQSNGPGPSLPDLSESTGEYPSSTTIKQQHRLTAQTTQHCIDVLSSGRVEGGVEISSELYSYKDTYMLVK